MRRLYYCIEHPCELNGRRHNALIAGIFVKISIVFARKYECLKYFELQFLPRHKAFSLVSDYSVVTTLRSNFQKLTFDYEIPNVLVKYAEPV